MDVHERRLATRVSHWDVYEASATGRLVGDSEELVAAWASFLGRYPWQLSVTLTFDPRKCSRVSSQLAEKEGKWILGQMARAARRTLLWALAIERHASGSWHAHALVAELPLTCDVAAEMELWRKRNGRAHARAVHDGCGIAAYSSKEAAQVGRMHLSDTLLHYRGPMRDSEVVSLWPQDHPPVR